MDNPENLSEQSIQNISHDPFSHYGFAWSRMWKYFLELLLVTIVSFILLLPTLGLNNDNTKIFGDKFVSIDLFIISFEGFGAYLILAIAYMLLFQWPLEYGISYVNLRAARGEKIQVQNIFEAFNNYWNAVFANLLVATIIGFGFMLLIIPGIIFACKLAFVPYLVVDKKMDAVEAVKTSWQMTSGHTLLIFLMGFFTIFIILLGLISFGVGIVISIIWIRLAFATVYFSVSEKFKINKVYL